MSEIVPFTFPETGGQVRVVMRDGEPWFVAADVCAVLGIGNPSQAVSYLDDDERSETLITSEGIRGNPTRAIVSEAGLYSLILRSRKPEAKAFKRWVTHEVLPSIRKTGGYSLAPVYRLPQTYAEALRELADTVEERDRLRAELEVAEPKAESWDALASARGDYSLREAAQILDRDPAIDTGQNRLMSTLRELGWVDRNGVPYQRHVDAGRLAARARSYTHPYTGEPVLAKPQIRITVKGLHELHRLLGGERPLMLPMGGAA